MQLVVDIPEEEYERFKKDQKREYCASMLDVNIIANGVPLPKGHGKIGDLDKLYAVFERNVAGANAYKPLFDAIDPIIEAESEIENECSLDI